MKFKEKKNLNRIAWWQIKCFFKWDVYLQYFMKSINISWKRLSLSSTAENAVLRNKVGSEKPRLLFYCSTHITTGWLWLPAGVGERRAWERLGAGAELFYAGWTSFRCLSVKAAGDHTPCTAGAWRALRREYIQKTGILRCAAKCFRKSKCYEYGMVMARGMHAGNWFRNIYLPQYL